MRSRTASGTSFRLWVAIAVIYLAQILPGAFSATLTLHLIVKPFVPSRLARFFIVDLPFVVAWISIALVFMRILYRLDVYQSLRRMGLFTVNRRAMLAGCAALAAQAVGQFGPVFLSGGGLEWRPNLAARLLFTLSTPVLMEELLDRGFVLRNLRDRMPLWTAIATSAVLFTGIHWNILAPLWIANAVHHEFWHSVIHYLLAGFAYGYLYEASGRSLPACMVAHFGGDLMILVEATGIESGGTSLWHTHGPVIGSIAKPIGVMLATFVVLGRGASVRGLRTATKRHR